MKKERAENRYPVVVDYGVSLQQMIEAGEYDNEVSIKNFKEERKRGKETVIIELYQVNGGPVEAEPTIRWIAEAEGFRPATLRELLAFGIKFPCEQFRYDIATVGDSVESEEFGRQFPYLFQFDTDRCFSWTPAFRDGTCFAVVRK